MPAWFMIKIIYAIKIHLIFCFYSYIDNSRYSFCIGGIVWKRKTYFEVDIFNQCQKKEEDRNDNVGACIYKYQ